jgi:hypothetical protein
MIMSNKKILFLTGSGAVENSWEPVKDVLRKKYGANFPESDPNLVFATLINYLRWSCKAAQNEKLEISSNGRTSVRELNNELKDLKSNIAEALKTAETNESIKLRPEIDKIRNQFLNNSNVCIITTNWDMLTEKFAESNCYDKPLHLHGNTEKPVEMHLPSELAFEVDGISLNEHLKEFLDCFGKIDSLVLYGISLSPLDAELGILFSEGFNGQLWHSLQKVTIIDKNPCLVFERLRFILRDNTSIEWKEVQEKLICPNML